MVGLKVNEVEKIRPILGDSTELTVGSFEIPEKFHLGDAKYTCTRRVVDVENDDAVRSALKYQAKVLKEISTQGLLPPKGKFRLSIEECLILGSDVYSKVVSGGTCFEPMSELTMDTRDECGKREIVKTCRLLHCLSFSAKALEEGTSTSEPPSPPMAQRSKSAPY